MAIVVVTLNADGTASITTPIAQHGESESEAVVRVLKAMPGAEPLSAELVEAIRRVDHPVGASLPVADFFKRLASVYLAMALAPDGVQRKWDRIIGAGGLLSQFDTVSLTDPELRVMLGEAVGDGLLSQEQAEEVLSPI